MNKLNLNFNLRKFLEKIVGKVFLYHVLLQEDVKLSDYHE